MNRWKRLGIQAKTIVIGTLGFGIGGAAGEAVAIYANNDFSGIPKDEKTIYAQPRQQITQEICAGEVAKNHQEYVKGKLSQFHPAPDKPIMIFIYDEGTSFSLNNGFQSGSDRSLAEKCNDASVTADRKAGIAMLQQHYGNNLLMVSSESLDYIAENMSIPQGAAVQVVISAHHADFPLTKEDSGIYLIGNSGFADKTLDIFLNKLPVDFDRLTVVHCACERHAYISWTKGQLLRVFARSWCKTA
jgi:hypothetical protein